MLHLLYYFLIDWDFIIAHVQPKTADSGEVGEPRVLPYPFQTQPILRFDVDESAQQIFELG